ncbi:hypothetical protein IQ235_08710 [Oscillatoriales cyanobacterium LEGE 11467]|uniref:Uncharacterized protein n=1 Tax=Zarconia navalis LEGE 11467 TaxID=1828826 RepID=A0A928VWJ9_9CYAN|nr:hypothetical protein [Zarconia navalis]MBE9040859.1 hypothetical protein [Zarconia navalis LEGE 11467]
MDGLGVTVVEFLINAVRAYIYAGLLFSAVFVIFFIQRVDSDAAGWNIGFRLVILPGLCVFWPMFVTRLIRGKQRPTERNAHRIAAARHQPVEGGSV